MDKFFLVIIFLTIFKTSIYAKETGLYLLDHVYSNAVQKFIAVQNKFICKNYGIITIDELYQKAKNDSVCQKSIKDFYTKNPILLDFAKNLLKQKQLYKITFRQNRCIIYASGQSTLSEMLLKNALAIVKPGFNDKEFVYLYRNTQKYAKKNKAGLFKSKIIKNCIAELYK